MHHNKPFLIAPSVLSARSPRNVRTPLGCELFANLGLPVFWRDPRHLFVIFVYLFLTGHGDVHLAVRTMKACAFDFVENPFNDQILLDLVQKAILKDEVSTSERIKIDAIQGRLNVLTSGEKRCLRVWSMDAPTNQLPRIWA